MKSKHSTFNAQRSMSGNSGKSSLTSTLKVGRWTLSVFFVSLAFAQSPTPSPTPASTPDPAGKVYWDANTEPDLAGYRVYVKQFGDLTYKGFVDVGITESVAFAVTSYNTAGKESPVTIATVDCPTSTPCPSVTPWPTPRPTATPKPTPRPVMQINIVLQTRPTRALPISWPAAPPADHVTRYVVYQAGVGSISTTTNNTKVSIARGWNYFTVAAFAGNVPSARGCTIAIWSP